MEVTYSIKQFDLDLNKKVYECAVCGKLFNWNNDSRWFGSLREMDKNPEKVKVFCSEKCIANK